MNTTNINTARAKLIGSFWRARSNKNHVVFIRRICYGLNDSNKRFKIIQFKYTEGSDDHFSSLIGHCGEMSAMDFKSTFVRITADYWSGASK